MRFMLLVIPEGYEQVQGLSNFPDDVQEAAAGFAEMRARAGRGLNG